MYTHQLREALNSGQPPELQELKQLMCLIPDGKWSKCVKVSLDFILHFGSKSLQKK